MVVASIQMLQPCCAQIKEDYEYERASLCMMLIKHHEKKFGNEIQYVFSRMQVPMRFNDHDLGVRLVSFASERKQLDNIKSFIQQVNLGKRCISKWFNRNKASGLMDMELIKERGLYNATLGDVNVARNQIRGLALLEDAGEMLIGNTYLVMNDITYVDHSTGWNIFKDVINFTKNITDIWTKDNVSDVDNPFVNSDLSSINATLDDIKGFRVKVKTYLFKLKWNNEIANQFYNMFYIDSENPDPAKFSAFKSENELFEMEYVGMVENTSTKASLNGVTTNEQLITKVCTRALDKNIADLQHEFEDFRIKAPIVNISPIQVQIGLKEDVSESSRFEVLERRIKDDGRVEYKRVGIVKPVKDKIWDNRFMSIEENALNSNLLYTEFVKVSGSDFYPGMFIREIK